MVVARRHNERELTGDPTAHAEVLALRDAAAAVGSWRLSGATMVVTLEPCPMCAGALVNARVDRLVYGAREPRRRGDAARSTTSAADPRLNHEFATTADVRAEECAALLTRVLRRATLRPSGPTRGPSDAADLRSPASSCGR